LQNNNLSPHSLTDKTVVS